MSCTESQRKLLFPAPAMGPGGIINVTTVSALVVTHTNTMGPESRQATELGTTYPKQNAGSGSQADEQK